MGNKRLKVSLHKVDWVSQTTQRLESVNFFFQISRPSQQKSHFWIHANKKKTTPSYRHLAIRLLHRRISPSSSTPKLFWGWKKTFIRRHDEPRWGIIGPSSKLMMAIVTLCVQSIKRVWPSHYRSAKIKRKQQNSIFIPLGSSYNFVVVVVKLSYQPL